jgi:hypothetical protein
VAVVLLPRATGSVDLPGQPKMTLEQLIQSAVAFNPAQSSRARRSSLPSGGKAHASTWTGLVFQVAW